MTVEEVYVDSFDRTNTAWIEVPVLDSYVYLNDNNTDYIYIALANALEGDFGFPASAGSGTINSVKLRFETKISKALGNNDVEVYVWDGSSYNRAGILAPTSTSYGWEELDVSAILDTWAKINAAKIYLKLIRFDAYAIYVRRATRKADYTAVAVGVSKSYSDGLVCVGWVGQVRKGTSPWPHRNLFRGTRPLI